MLPREEAFVGTRPDQPFAELAVEVEVSEVEDARGENGACPAVGALRRLNQFLCSNVVQRTRGVEHESLRCVYSVASPVPYDQDHSKRNRGWHCLFRRACATRGHHSFLGCSFCMQARAGDGVPRGSSFSRSKTPRGAIMPGEVLALVGITQATKHPRAPVTVRGEIRR